MANTGRYALLNVLGDLQQSARKIQSLAGDIAFALSQVHAVAIELAEAMDKTSDPRCGHCGVQGTQAEILEHLKLGYCPKAARERGQI